MNFSNISARRPLKSRATNWAQKLAKILLKTGLTPNTISMGSLVFACFGAIAIYGTKYGIHEVWLWLGAAILIQMRLLCNLMDGMLAVEGGLGTADGDIYNEMPDRLADLVLLIAAGYASCHPYGNSLGWLSGCGAVMTAYIRMHGASLTGSHDFRGPLAKPQRMAILTGLCLLMPLAINIGWSTILHLAVLVTLAIGIWLTVFLRLIYLSKTLRQET